MRTVSDGKVQIVYTTADRAAAFSRANDLLTSSQQCYVVRSEANHAPRDCGASLDKINMAPRRWKKAFRAATALLAILLLILGVAANIRSGSANGVVVLIAAPKQP